MTDGWMRLFYDFLGLMLLLDIKKSQQFCSVETAVCTEACFYVIFLTLLHRIEVMSGIEEILDYSLVAVSN